MRRLALVTLLLALAPSAPARADLLLPPAGRVFHGLTGGLSTGVFARGRADGWLLGLHDAIAASGAPTSCA